MPNIRITSPEQIHDYIRVTSPGVWIILSAIIAFLTGLFIWIFTGSLEISFSAPVYTEGGISRAFLKYDDFSRLKTGMHTRIHESKITGKIINLSRDVLNYEDIIKFTGANNFHLMGLDEHANFLQAIIKFNQQQQQEIPEITQASFIIENIKPVNFLLK
ncbi:MAG: hypothetical protein IJS99_01375 [Synergistaceae bacterium]|nr:hypothetical protein [Synergistaceae bacterium]